MTTELFTPGEVARAFNVHPKTVWKWSQQGKLQSITTIGGHHRYHADQVRALLQQTPAGPETDRSRWVRENHAAIRKVPCPLCEAAAGESCRGPAGHRVYIPHQARRHAAAEAGVYTP